MVRVFNFFKRVLPVMAGITLLIFGIPRAHGKNLNCAQCGAVTRQKSPLDEASFKLTQSIAQVMDRISLTAHSSVNYSTENLAPAPAYSRVHLMKFPRPVNAEDSIVLPHSLELAANRPAWYEQSLQRSLSQMDPTFQAPFWTPERGLFEHPSAPWHYDWETWMYRR